MVNPKILEAVKTVRASNKRNFKQTFDLIINLKNIDLKKPENRIKTEIFLPHGLGKVSKIGFITDVLITQVRSLEDVVLIRKDELDAYGKNKKLAKSLAKSCRYFISEAALMPLVGKNLGQVLAPLNRMPYPIPTTTTDLKSLIEQKRKVVRIQIKETPTIHLAIGTEIMKDEEIAENIETFLKGVEEILPKGKENIKSVLIKLTMGPPIKIDLK